MNIECPNCGYGMSTGDKKCKYCGSINANFVEPNSIQSVVSGISRQASNFVNGTSSNSSNHNENVGGNFTNGQNTSKSSFNVFVFIILLFLCGPFAIIYPIVTCTRKN